MSISSSVRVASRSARSASLTRPHSIFTPVRACGIDVSARAGNQRLVTLEKRDGRLVRRLSGARHGRRGGRDRHGARARGGGDRRPVGLAADLLAPGAPARAALALPEGRYERMRVCDALLFRRGLPLYPVPSAAEGAVGWNAWMAVGLRAVRCAAAHVRPLRPREPAPDAPRDERRLRPRARPRARDLPGRDLLRPARPPARAQAQRGRPAGARRARSSAPACGPRRRRADGRTHDELDACAAALAAHALAAGRAQWLGDPAEGVVVLPGERLLERYRKPPDRLG